MHRKSAQCICEKPTGLYDWQARLTVMSVLAFREEAYVCTRYVDIVIMKTLTPTFDMRYIYIKNNMNKTTKW